MKKGFLLLLINAYSVILLSQENRISLSGGYSFANVEESDINAKGWRINGIYEFNPGNGKIAHGISIGLVSLHAEGDENPDNTTYNITSLPIYYAPRFLFGGQNLKGFVKGALGLQRSWIKRTGIGSDLEDRDYGFTGGAGAGGLCFINEKIFLNVEYELLWCSNSYYRDGILSTISLGLGLRF